jgi:hypothetical protein
VIVNMMTVNQTRMIVLTYSTFVIISEDLNVILNNETLWFHHLNFYYIISYNRLLFSFKWY